MSFKNIIILQKLKDSKVIYIENYQFPFQILFMNTFFYSKPWNLSFRKTEMIYSNLGME